jgi:hypothetical protein
MNNQLELYEELKKLQSIVDKKIVENNQNINHRNLPESRIDTLKRWVLNWLD